MEPEIRIFFCPSTNIALWSKLTEAVAEESHENKNNRTNKLVLALNLLQFHIDCATSMDKEDYEIVRLLEIEHQTKANE